MGMAICVIILPPLLVICLLFTGPPIFFKQERVGHNQKIFILIKLRTMERQTDSVATHLASPNSVTKFGKFLRKSKLDEIPQLWNVFKGDMSLVGPRPCLPSQFELIVKREKLGLYNVRPGITGLAQIHGIDMSMPELLVKKEAEMIESLTLVEYFRYILFTLLGKGAGDQVKRK